MTEADIQRAIVEYCNAVLLPSHRIFAVPNASRRTLGGRASNAVAGLLPGVPDLMIVGAGKAWFIEVKGPKGVLSDAQSDFGIWCITKGGMPWVCARSVDDVFEFLLHCGIPTRRHEIA